MSYTIFTLGYEKRTLNEFVSILKDASVGLVLDVRETAWSHKRDFCKTRFSDGLRKKGIDYLHLPEAGNPKKIRKTCKTVEQCLDSYRLYLNRTGSGIDALEKLIALSKKEHINICLTCFERDHLLCHRSIITDAIVRIPINCKVVHL